MDSTTLFEFILLLLVVVIGLELLAERLHLPPAAALIVGGIALAFMPGVPSFTLDPNLVLVLFLPPLLMNGAYFTALADFRRNLPGILSLAVGAVAFTTLAVGTVAHWMLPGLSWAACFTLGAVVSPPDAVAAKAVLERVKLPRTLTTLLEGESLLNDAAGLVLFRFAVAAALTGAFSPSAAMTAFGLLAGGGFLVGLVTGFAWVALLRRLRDDPLVITASFLLPWAAYIGGERLHVSGVISTVTAGLVIGWFQHDVFSASTRVRAAASWQVMVFILEALVFILIGLSLRSAVESMGGADSALHTLARPVLAVVAVVIVSRFAWVFGTGALGHMFGRVNRRHEGAFSAAAATLVSWAGMRGVVTLAIALSLPEEMPGREVILASAFGVILVTVLLQGTTIGPLIHLLRLPDETDELASTRGQKLLSQTQAEAALADAQLAAVKALARGQDGRVLHPRLLEQFTFRAQVKRNFAEHNIEHDGRRGGGGRAAHYEVLLAAIAAGRSEVLRLHRTGRIHDEVLRDLENKLDHEEIAAGASRGD